MIEIMLPFAILSYLFSNAIQSAIRLCRVLHDCQRPLVKI